MKRKLKEISPPPPPPPLSPSNSPLAIDTIHRRLLPVQPPPFVTHNVPPQKPQQSTSVIPSSQRIFTLMTYNILAQCLIKRDLFPYCTKAVLKLKTRVSKIIREILVTHQPDIACLQEVDNYKEIYEPQFKKFGYDSVYHKKNETSLNGHGLCIIWKKNMFEKQLYKPIHFDQSHLTHPTNISPITNNVAQLIALQFKEDSSSSSSSPPSPSPCSSSSPLGVILTNHHLYWRPSAQFVKLRQCLVLLEELKEFSMELKKSWPTFICGDFNTVPSDATYQLLTKTGDLTEDQLLHLTPNIDVESDYSNTSPDIISPLTLNSLISKIKEYPPLRSVYSTYRSTDPNHSRNPNWFPDLDPYEGEPTYTNYTEWKGTLDYIFYLDQYYNYIYNRINTVMNRESGEKIIEMENENRKDNEIETNNYIEIENGIDVEVLKILEIPKIEFLEPGLPNDVFGSDHVCLMSEIKLKT